MTIDHSHLFVNCYDKFTPTKVISLQRHDKGKLEILLVKILHLLLHSYRIILFYSFRYFGGDCFLLKHFQFFFSNSSLLPFIDLNNHLSHPLQIAHCFNSIRFWGTYLNHASNPCSFTNIMSSFQMNQMEGDWHHGTKISALTHKTESIISYLILQLYDNSWKILTQEFQIVYSRFSYRKHLHTSKNFIQYFSLFVPWITVCDMLHH